MKRIQKRSRDERRGAVAVEFAAIAPVLMAIVLGLVEVNRIYETQNLLAMAAREGARFASLDREGVEAVGSGNEMLKDDVLNYLEANGLARDNVTVDVRDYENPDVEFDIDDPENALRLFQVDVTVDYTAVSFTPVEASDDYPLTASAVFRNSVGSLDQ